MKKYITALLLGLMACRPQPIVQVPVVIPVEGVNVEPEPQEKQYVPSVQWTVAPILPEYLDSEELKEYFDEVVLERDRQYYRRVYSKATFTSEGRKLNLECNGGINASVTCVSDGSQVKLGCEIMFFRVSCELK